jgi:hypothetical protein
MPPTDLTVPPSDIDKLLPICMGKVPALTHDDTPEAWAKRAIDLLEAVIRERKRRFNY